LVRRLEDLVPWFKVPSSPLTTLPPTYPPTQVVLVGQDFYPWIIQKLEKLNI